MPPLAFNVPLTAKLPSIIKLLEVLILPVTIRFENENSAPLITLLAPLSVVLPPVCWVYLPAPVVVKLPAMVIAVKLFTVMVASVRVRLLKLKTPVPAIVLFKPRMFIVPVLPFIVPAFKILPAKLWVVVLQFKVVFKPSVTLPLTVILAVVLKDNDVALLKLVVKSPPTVNAVDEVVFVTAPPVPASTRLP